MARKPVHQIVSANDLLNGAVVYFAKDNCWSLNLADAHIAADPASAAALLTEAQRDPSAVVGPYLVGVDIDADGAPRPSHMREVMRVSGPSVARQHLCRPN